jgi:spore coat protein CotF
LKGDHFSKIFQKIFKNQVLATFINKNPEIMDFLEKNFKNAPNDDGNLFQKFFKNFEKT